MAELAQLTDEWPTVEEAAARLQTSIRTVWRYAKEGAIQTRKRPRPGKKPEVLCNPQDVERLMPPEVHVMPAEGQALTLKRRANSDDHSWEGALRRIATILTRQNDTFKIGTKPWLSLKEAAEGSGICESALRKLVADGQIKGMRIGQHRSLRILAVSLEAFEG